LKKKNLAFLCLFGLVLSPLLFSLSFFDEVDDKILAQRIVNAMSNEQALAQCFMLGWVGAEPSPLILNWIRERNIGGVKIFGWNTDDTRRLAQTVGSLQTHALNTPFAIPLFVATDQEGGWIRHVKGATSETPGNMAIGASGFPMDAYLSGLYIGRELSLLGINMNFAPTIDLFTAKDSYLIGPRSFGMDPVQVGILGAAFARGHEVSGVIPTAKHFPGHGDTHLDSHGVLPRIDISFETLWQRELIPYRLMIRQGIPAIMSGHLAFPNTYSRETPASLSSWFLQNILRDQMGFQGLIITDDLMMNGATNYAGSLSEAAKRAMIAGNDIIMLSQTPNMFDRIWTYLLLSMREERDFHDRVRDAARRILESKLKYLKGDNRVPFVPDLKRVDEELPDPEGAAFFLNLAARSVTIVKDAGNSGELVFPLNPEKAGIVLLAGRYDDFFSVGARAFPKAQIHRTQSRNAGNFAAELLLAAQNVDTVIFCLSDAEELRLLQNLRGLGKRVIVFSILSPIHIEEALWADGILAVYSYAPDSFIAGFSAILGRIHAGGRLPFPLNSTGGEAR
jgi:beta-N-acetylhexosaminidase